MRCLSEPVSSTASDQGPSGSRDDDQDGASVTGTGGTAPIGDTSSEDSLNLTTHTAEATSERLETPPENLHDLERDSTSNLERDSTSSTERDNTSSLERDNTSSLTLRTTEHTTKPVETDSRHLHIPQSPPGTTHSLAHSLTHSLTHSPPAQVLVVLRTLHACLDLPCKLRNWQREEDC